MTSARVPTVERTEQFQPRSSSLSGTVNAGTPFEVRADRSASESAYAAVVGPHDAEDDLPLGLADTLERLYWLPLPIGLGAWVWHRRRYGTVSIAR